MAWQPPVMIRSSRVTFPKAEIWIPVVTQAPNAAAGKQMNETIKDTVRKLIENQGSLEDPRAEMQGYYEVKTNEKNVLSLSLFNYAYTGGAHGLTLQASLTFDTTSGRSYSLAQLFKPGSPYIRRLSELVKAQIAVRKLEPLQPFESIRPDQDFYVADRSLVIYFQLYELLPYVYGFVYFPISVYEIQDIVNEQGPLGPMLVGD
ncbi:DUF3298 and DUF4163 domain-containing protein [Paenibacillus sp. GCM10023252]|uniref:DUF3298 and DUF4163 domain-containing protein n=1 Tax=Paenibacillus sp. GCM10023252 TaxID=3252649 RepID=UPI003621C77F